LNALGLKAEYCSEKPANNPPWIVVSTIIAQQTILAAKYESKSCPTEGSISEGAIFENVALPLMFEQEVCSYRTENNFAIWHRSFTFTSNKSPT
jgi:hypothetical protein